MNSHFVQPCFTPPWEQISIVELVLQHGGTKALLKKDENVIAFNFSLQEKLRNSVGHLHHGPYKSHK